MTNNKNKSKVLLIIIGILLVANLTMVTFYLVNKYGKKHNSHPDRKTMTSNFLKTEIGFDSVQLKQYDSLSTRHKENMKRMFDSLKVSKDGQFRQLTNGKFSDSVMDKVATQSAANQKIMELMMFNHLRNVRMLCKPLQFAAFDSLFIKTLSRHGGDARKKTPTTKKSP